MDRKLLIVQVAALSADFPWRTLPLRPARSVFPAVTCPVQASFRTASAPRAHGVVGNGWLFRDLTKILFWEQSANLVAGGRIWDDFRAKGGTVGMLFWQQSLGEPVDLLLSPAPIHKHHGGMIQDCYSSPPGLYAKLCRAVGSRFNLMHYWGPLASARVGEWIASATAALLRDRGLAPDLLLTYLPSLDYDLQRYGPRSPRCAKAIQATAAQLDTLHAAAREAGYELLVFGDYAMGEVTGGPVYPNRALREAGLLKTRQVKDMLYPDLYASDAFALCDHEIAHVYLRNPDVRERTREVLAGLDGVESAMERDETTIRSPQSAIRDSASAAGEPPRTQSALGIGHPRSGELVLIAREGQWFAYPWWSEASQEPDYARHVDIHNKPGYDPCELFFGFPPMSVSRNADRIRGSHGRVGPGRDVGWATTLDLDREPRTLLEIAELVREWLAR